MMAACAEANFYRWVMITLTKFVLSFELKSRALRGLKASGGLIPEDVRNKNRDFYVGRNV